MRFQSNPTVIVGHSVKTISDTINGFLNKTTTSWPLSTFPNFGHGFVNKVENNFEGRQYLKELRKGLKQIGLYVQVFGRNPNRKKLGLSRSNGWLRREDSTQLYISLKNVSYDRNGNMTKLPR